MQTRFNLFFPGLFAFAAIVSGQPSEAVANRTVCGVDVQMSGRCFRELRRLRSACAEEPELCGHRYQAGDAAPQLTDVQARCRRLRRQNRRRWSRGLCGVSLFSPPKTYCGMKGVEVATACVAEALQNKKVPAAGSVPTRTAPATPPSNDSPGNSGQTNNEPAPSPSGSAPSSPAAMGSVAPAARAQTPATQKPSTPPATRARLTTEPSSYGFPWALFLQLFTMLLVLYMLLRRNSPRQSQKEWLGESNWDMPSGAWQAAGSDSRSQERVLSALQKMEERLQSWQESRNEQLERLTSPLAQMQAQADDLLDYYTHLGRQVLQQTGGQDGGHSEVRRQLLEARERLNWLFQAHRELPTQHSPIEELKASLWHRMQAFLETLGHSGGDAQLQDRIAEGTFSATEYTRRKAIDQAQRYLEGEKLQSFSVLKDEFLQCLEHMYRANLRHLVDSKTPQESLLSPEEEQNVFWRDYILGFLLDELPLMLQELTRRSSPAHSGALVDQVAQFIEQEVKSAGLELFPVLDQALTETINARLIYLLHAGVRRVGEKQKIFRKPNTSVVSAGSFEMDASEVIATRHSFQSESDQESELTGEESTVASFLESESPEMQEGDSVKRASWFNSPQDFEESFFDPHTLQSQHPDGEDENEETTDFFAQEDPQIAHPDSDPPEQTAETASASFGPAGRSEPLPVGPLPRIEGATQSFKAVPDAARPAKVTREYGPTERATGADK